MAFHSGTELIDPAYVLRRSGIRPGFFVADLGCGAIGHFVFPAAEAVGPTGKVYAVDIQKSVLQAVERQSRLLQLWNVTPIWSDIDVVGATSIPPASLDLTLIVNNFFLSTNRVGLVQEAKRLTKPGGRILVAEWKKKPSTIGPEIDRRLSSEEIKSCFMDVDLALVLEFEAGSEHDALLYRRFEGDAETEILSVSSST